MVFQDRVQVCLVSGKGGQGAVHFRRTGRSLRAGPDGGDGGKGGDLILSPSPDLKDLSHLKSVYKAEDGKPGGKGKKKGSQGKDLILPLPEGTVCYDLSSGKKLKELEKKPWLFLKGGKGGKGNAFFKTSRMQAPRLAQPGEPAKKQKVALELKWVSSAVLVGLRSTGKTSLMLSLIQKKQKLFPSAYPKLFSVTDPDFFDLIWFVDLPGLSLSTQKFLKQAEKSKMIIFFVSLLDPNPFSSYEKLKKELSTYDKKHNTHLSRKPTVLLLTGEKSSITVKKVKLFQKESIKTIYFFSHKNLKQVQTLMGWVRSHNKKLTSSLSTRNRSLDG